MVRRKVLTKEAQRVLTKEQLRVIKQYINKGFSDKDVRKRLQQLKIRVKSADLSRHIAMVKSIREKFIRARLVEYFRSPELRKQITLVGRHLGKPAVKRLVGTGKELYRQISEEMESDFWDVRPEVFS